MPKTNLVIVESPAKAKTIGKYLGRDYQVIASMGRIRDLPKSKLGVDIDAGFVPNYQPIKGKEEIIAALENAAADSERVFLATDPDREGEAISWHLKELLDLPDDKTYRVTFNEITKKVVQREHSAAPGHRPGPGGRPAGPPHPGPHCGLSALARCCGRRCAAGLSAGRVQSVATRMVVDREQEIRAFEPEEYWTIDVTLHRVGGRRASFTARYYGDGENKGGAAQRGRRRTQSCGRRWTGCTFTVASVKRGGEAAQPRPARSSPPPSSRRPPASWA